MRFRSIPRRCRLTMSIGLLFFIGTSATGIYTLSLHDALPISPDVAVEGDRLPVGRPVRRVGGAGRSEEHTSELQSLRHLVCRLLLEKKNNNNQGAYFGERPCYLNLLLHLLLQLP